MEESIVQYVVAISERIPVRASFRHRMDLEKKWVLVADAPVQKQEFLPRRLEIYSPIPHGMRSLDGSAFIEKLHQSKSYLGQRQAEALCDGANQGVIIIPGILRAYDLLCPKTFWQHTDKTRMVAGLAWSGTAWFVGFYWLDRHFDASYRLIGSSGAF